jgi:hypothetical protein
MGPPRERGNGSAGLRSPRSRLREREGVRLRLRERERRECLRSRGEAERRLGDRERVLLRERFRRSPFRLSSGSQWSVRLLPPRPVSLLSRSRSLSRSLLSRSLSRSRSRSLSLSRSLSRSNSRSLSLSRLSSISSLFFMSTSISAVLDKTNMK